MDIDAHRARVTAALRVHIEDAARSICQEHLALWRHPKEHLKLAAAREHGPDLNCHAPCTVWRCLQHSSGSIADCAAGIRIETVSEYGLKRAETFSSAADLTRAILNELSADARHLVASTHVREADGLLLVTTRLHLSKQRAAGRLQCVQCGEFCAEGRGLRDHMQVKHSTDYGMAQAAAEAARGAIILRPPAGSAAALLAQLWEASAAAARAEHRRLPPLLAAARDGDLGSVLRELARAAGVHGAGGRGEGKGVKLDSNGSDRSEAMESGGATATGRGRGSAVGNGAAAAVAAHSLVGKPEATGLLDLILRDPACAARAAEHARRTRDNYGSTALHWSAGAGQVAVLSALARLGVSVADPGGQKDGRTGLHWAARNGQLRACRWLVAHGADANARTADGTCALHWAVWRGELGVAQYLVDEAGADLHSTNHFGCNAIQWAAQSDSGELRMCRWLRDRGLDMKLLNRNGHSALHKAAVKGNRAACEWLLAADGGGLGVRHLQPDGDGNTPSRMARFEGFGELADHLEMYERMGHGGMGGS
jgi:ankyrin repeat protein